MKQETNYMKLRKIMAEYGESMDLNFLVSLLSEMEDVLMKHPSDYEAIEKEYKRIQKLEINLHSGAFCPRCNHPLYLSDMKRIPNGHVCVRCDEAFTEKEVC